MFTERCEEYFDVRPLSDGEILASLSVVRKGTAKDWLLADSMANWKQFKEQFMHSFLSVNYRDLTFRKLLERKQGAKESFRDFTFQYCALCLQLEKR